MKNISLSLADIAGEEYISSVCRASAFCGLGRFEELQTIAHEKVDFFPEEFQKKIDDLLPLCGQNVISPLANSSGGAATAAFAAAFHREPQPLRHPGVSLSATKSVFQ